MTRRPGREGTGDADDVPGGDPDAEPGGGPANESPACDGAAAIESAFEGDPALVPYVVAGDPGLDATADHVRALARGGADAVELGLPFSEPVADGPTIQAGIRRALDAETTPERYFELVDGLDVDPPLACMTYFNLVYRYGDGPGVGPFVARAAAAGIDGLVVPDLPVEESGPLARACDEHGLALVFVVAPTTRGERLARIRERVSGFVYVQARLGTTGAREAVSERTHESLARLADWPVPRAVGFGVSQSDHAREIVAAGADGVVAGSVFVDIVAERDDPVAALESKTRSLKAGALDGAEQRVPEPEGT